MLYVHPFPSLATVMKMVLGRHRISNHVSLENLRQNKSISKMNEDKLLPHIHVVYFYGITGV